MDKHIHTPVKVGLAAYGMSGRVFHAPLIEAHTGFVFSKVVDRSGSKRVNERYPLVRVVKHLDDIVNDAEIELIVINTPEHTHYELAKQAILAGKHVVVEKAFTVTSQQAQALINLAQKKKVMLSVFQNARWHGDFITIQKIIKENLLGRMVSFEAHYDRYRNFIQPGAWKEEDRPGTGSLYNLGPHLIDQALVLFGLPEAVYADLQIQREGGKVIDDVELKLYYKGLRVMLKSSYLVREPGPRYILHGSEGSFIKHGTDPQEAFLKAGGSPFAEHYGYEHEDWWGRLNTTVGGLHVTGRVETERGSYLGYYENIYNVLRKKAPLAVTAEQGLQTIKIIEAAEKSNKAHQKVFL